MKLENILDDVFFTKKIEEEKKESGTSLKVFYDIDALIQNFPEEEEENKEKEEVKQTTPPKEVEQAETPTQEETEQKKEEINESVELNEDIFTFKAKGEINVDKNKVESIQTLLDLLQFVKEQKKNGKPIINSLIIEIVAALAGVGEKGVEDLVNKGDKILITIDYGFTKKDSVGLRINKTAGAKAVSLSLKLDNEIVPAAFNIIEFNRQLIYYRNTYTNR